MKRVKFKEKQIIGILKEEAGAKTADVCRTHGISGATFYKWKAKYGGLEVSEARRLKALEDAIAKLKKQLAEAITMSKGGPEHSTSAANMRCHRPRWLHRFYRLNTRRIRPIFVGKCTPLTALAQPMDHVADDAATILAFRSRMNHRNMRRDRRPLLIAEPEIIGHESSPAERLESPRGGQSLGRFGT
jgi:putative transposase